jgi:hypothetical protein
MLEAACAKYFQKFYLNMSQILLFEISEGLENSNSLTNNKKSSYLVSSIPTLSTFNHFQFFPLFIHITAEYTHVT